jgi:two-component system, OmpR family, aerobic respiration control sensor histidine kinase ArcB
MNQSTHSFMFDAEALFPLLDRAKLPAILLDKKSNIIQINALAEQWLSPHANKLIDANFATLCQTHHIQFPDLSKATYDKRQTLLFHTSCKQLTFAILRLDRAENGTYYLITIERKAAATALEHTQQQKRTANCDKTWLINYRLAFEVGRQKALESSNATKNDFSHEQLQEMAKLTKEIFGEAHVSATSIIEHAESLRHFFEFILNVMPASIYWMDKNRRYLGCNRRNAKLLQLNHPSKFVGKTIFDFLETSAARAVDATDKKVIKTGKPLRLEETAVDPDGKKSVYLTHKVPVISSQGETIGMAGVSLDITERKKAESALKRAKTIAETANQAKSDFLAMMTHELRTPLNIILGMTNIMQKEELHVDRRNHYLSTIFSSGQSLLELINNILDFSKAQAGKLELHEAAFSPQSLLDQIQAELGYKAAEKKVLLHVEGKNLPPALSGDSQRIRQIIYNLTDNALKFTQIGEVRVTLQVAPTKTSKKALQITINDTGVGIPEDKIKDIFKSFTQVRGKKHDRYSRRYGGVGLGLAIVQKLVRLMKGHINIESTFGVGTTFTISIPCKLTEKPIETEEQDTPNLVAPQTRIYRILLVEDNLLNQKVVAHMLTSLKCQVSLAINGKEALEKLQSHSFDLVFMDLSLPDMNGLEITQQFRNQESPNQHLPIIALTAHAHLDDEKQCMASGMDGFLVKPVLPERLQKVLTTFVPA